MQAAARRVGAGARRSWIVALTLAVLAPLTLQVQTLQAQAAPVALYPDLKTLPPRDLRLASANVNADGTANYHNVLEFTNTVYNAGTGPLDLRAVIDSTLSPPSGPTQQRVYDDAGNYTSYAAGTMYYHPAHGHYHYEGWGSYQLWTKADYDTWLNSGRSQGTPKATGSKTTSCVIDEEFIGQRPGTPYPAVYGAGATGCQLDAANSLHEGLSVGWGDTYDYYRFEQWIDLGSSTATLADGDYVLRSVTDPNNQIYESAGKADSAHEGQQDNEAATSIRVSGGQLVDQYAPTGTLTINDIDGSTGSASVNVGALGRDDLSGVDAFRLSNDGVTYAPESAYTSSGSVATYVGWNLTDARYGGTAATGTKTVYVQFHDRSGRWGPAQTDTIVYGTAAPPPPPPPPSDYSTAVTKDSPLGYWRLGEASGTQAVDSTGRHPGTYLNGVVLGRAALVPSAADTSVALDGSNDQVQVADAPDLAPAALSLEAWVRPGALPAVGGFASIVSKAESYSLQFNGPRLEFTVIQAGVRRRLQAPAGAVVAGSTYHVVGTLDGTVQRLYVNDDLVASASVSGSPSASSSPLFLGTWDGVNEFLQGGVDDVAVYGTALSGAQVDAHWTASRPASTATMPVSVTRSGTGTGSVTSSPAGISCGSTCSASFPSSTVVTLSASPASGSVFSGWGEGACNGSTTPTCSFTAYAATPVTAVFQSTAGAAYDLSVTRGGAGTGRVVSSPAGIDCGTTCGASFGAGTTVTLTASPAAGSVFSGWAGACSGTGACTVTVNASTSVSATFALNAAYSVSVTRAGNGSGTVTSSPSGISCGTTCTASFPAATLLTLTATPAPGATFSGWGGSCSGSRTTCTVTVNAALSVSAKFRR